jgi:hypothetical protein
MKATPTMKEQELRVAIGRREEQLDDALKDLAAAAEARASLGHYLARYPWQFLLGGLVVGAWLGRRR